MLMSENCGREELPFSTFFRMESKQYLLKSEGMAIKCNSGSGLLYSCGCMAVVGNGLLFKF